MFAKSCIVAAASVIAVTAVMAQTQTSSQLLENAIFAEDTAGDLTGAIRIYERLVSASTVPPEVSARARTRLLDARQRRDAAQRATADQTSTGQPGRIDPVPAPATAAPTPIRFADYYDARRPVAVLGTVTEVRWADPQVVVFLRTDDGMLWGFAMARPELMMRSGFTRYSLKAGDRLRAEGSLAKGDGANCPGPLPNGCATFANGAMHASARALSPVDANGNVMRVEVRLQVPDALPPVSGGRGERGGGGRGGPGPGNTPLAPPNLTQPQYADMYDARRPVTVRGRVTQVQWTDPNVVVFLQTDDGQLFGLVMGPPENLERTAFTRDALKVGDLLHADGTLARGDWPNCPAPLPNGCATFANGAVNVNARQLLRLDENGNTTRVQQAIPGAGGGGARGARIGGARNGGPP